MSYFTGMNNMQFDGCPLDQYGEDELAKILDTGRTGRRKNLQPH